MGLDLTEDLDRLDPDGEVELARRHVDELTLEALGEVLEGTDVGFLGVEGEEGLDRLAAGVLGLREGERSALL